MVDACETPMEDHIKRFHELLKVPGAIVHVVTPNPLGYDTAHFGEGFARSLSLRVEAEKRAREEEQRLRMMAEATLKLYGEGGGMNYVNAQIEAGKALAKRLHAAETHSAALARALEEEKNWMPIETAPKDGTPILVADKGPFPYVAEWQSRIKSWVGADGRCWEPTHWRELPALPAASRAAVTFHITKD